MKRRTFVRLGAAAAGLVLVDGCAPSRRVPRIGYLSPGPRAVFAERVGAFLQGLKELGYVEGQNIAIEWRFTATNDDAAATQLSDLAADLVGRESM